MNISPEEDPLLHRLFKITQHLTEQERIGFFSGVRDALQLRTVTLQRIDDLKGGAGTRLLIAMEKILESPQTNVLLEKHRSKDDSAQWLENELRESISEALDSFDIKLDRTN